MADPPAPIVGGKLAASASHDHFEAPESRQIPFDEFPGVNAHSVLARDVFEQAVDDNTLIRHDPRVESALSSLKSLIGSTKTEPSTLNRAGARSTSMPPGELPTLAELFPLLDHATGKCSVTSFVS